MHNALLGGLWTLGSHWWVYYKYRGKQMHFVASSSFNGGILQSFLNHSKLSWNGHRHFL